MCRITTFICSLFILFLCNTEAVAAAPLVASFTYSDTAVCQDSCLTFTSTSTGAIDSIRWKMVVMGFPVMLSNVTPSKMCFTSSVPAGSYTIRLVVYGGGVADSADQLITIKKKPHPVLHRSGSVLSVTGSYLSYQWYDGSTSIPGATASSYNFSGAGYFSVLVDSGGCPASSDTFASATLAISNEQHAENNYWISQSGGDGLMLNASQPLYEQMHINITDQVGRAMASDLWQQGSAAHAINTGSFPRGMYFLIVSNCEIRQVFRWTKQ